jgi:hypothetical protein
METSGLLAFGKAEGQGRERMKKDHWISQARKVGI